MSVFDDLKKPAKPSTLADKLLPIVKETKAKLAGMKDARPSALALVKEEFGDALLAVVNAASAADISPEAKIAAFDSFFNSQLEALKEEINSRIEGDYCEDSDTDHYNTESLKTGMLGNKIYDVTNEFEKLFR